MKAQTKTAVALFGGAAAVVLTVGIGGVGVSPVGGWTTTHPSTCVTRGLPGTATPAGSTGIHIAALTGCIGGLDC